MQLQFQIGVDNYFGWVSPDPTPSIEDVTCVLDGETLEVAQSSDRPEVFIFGPVKPAGAALDVPFTISVDGDAVAFGLANFVAAIATQVVALSSTVVRVASEPGQDIAFTLLDRLGDEMLSEPATFTESETNPGTYSGLITSPEASGFYIGVVLSDNTPIATQMFVVGLGGNQTCLFVAARVDGGSSTAIDAAEILVSRNDSECLPVVKLLTDDLGAASTTLGPGEYIATLRKADLVFSQNNFEFSVETISSLYRTIHLTTKWFTPTFSPITNASTVTLSGYVRRANGHPIADAIVTAEPLTSLIAVSSPVAYAKSSIVVKTSAAGYFELKLVPGIEVRVGIPAVGLTRTITVPDDDAELLPLLADAPDPFTIVNTQPVRKVSR